MPELPEVETTRRAIAPMLTNARLQQLVVRQRQLRWPIPPGLEQELAGIRFDRVGRRGKYLLLQSDRGTLMIHLGMSGSLRIVPKESPHGPHDHFDLILDGKLLLRYHDPRRFGSLLWTTAAVEQHPLLRQLGLEPVGTGTIDTLAEQLYQRSRGRQRSIKSHIMDHHVVTGVGNIYACEALFLSAIHPGTRCGRISRSRYQRLAGAIREVLQRAIEQGGTTLQDFYHSDGKPGYFQLQLAVYDRAGEPCPHCGAMIRQIRQNQRSTWYCGRCQH